MSTKQNIIKTFKKVSASDFNGDAEDGEFGLELSETEIENNFIIDDEPCEIIFFATTQERDSYLDSLGRDIIDCSSFKWA